MSNSDFLYSVVGGVLVSDGGVAKMSIGTIKNEINEKRGNEIY